MSDGNKRILGDVWINEENLNRQREFFRDIIESYQDKYGGEFDASTLQGFQASDFATAEQGAMAENAIKDPLWLGKKRIANIEDRQYIWTDAVLLDKDKTDTESSAYRLANIDWFKDDEYENVTDALVQIYLKTQEIRSELLAEFDTKLDEEVFNTFLTTNFNPLDEMINNSKIQVTDSTTGETRYGLNADLVNGLRPILITEEAYNDLKESEDENDQKIFNDWRNFFIFVDSLPSTYNQPWEYSLTDPYSFRVHDGYLQVKNNLNTVWANVAPLEDFLSGANFDSVIKNYLMTANDFNIQSTSLLNSLQLLSATTINENWNNYPFLSSLLHDDFVHSITLNNSSSYVTESVDSNTSFKNANINLTQILKDNHILKANGTSNIQELLTNVATHGSNITQLQTSMQSVQSTLSDVTRTNNTQTNNISSLNTSISDLQSKVEANKIYDTGWIDIIMQNSRQFDHYNTDSMKMRCRKIGKIVHIEGSFKSNKYWSANDNIHNAGCDAALVPAGFRPARAQRSIQQGTGNARYLCIVEPSGMIKVGSRYSINGTDAAIPDQAWLTCYMTYFVD